MEAKRRDNYQIALIIIFVCLLMARLAIVNTVPYSGLALRGIDAHFFFSHLRSILFEGNPDVRNEILYYLRTFALYPGSPTGLSPDVYPIGSAIFWFPFYVVAHLWALIISRFVGGGEIITPDGLSIPYQVSVYLANIFYSCMGGLIAYNLCSRFTSRRSAFLATTGLWLSSPLFFYTYFAPAMSHPVSFFTVTLFIYYALAGQSNTSGYWIKLGVLAGFMTLVRWQNGLYLILPALISFKSYCSFLRERNNREIVRLLSRNISFLLIFAALFSLQAAVWKKVWGSWLLVPQSRCIYIDMDMETSGSSLLLLTKPHIVSLLFSMRNGLFTFAPLILVASFGFIFLWRKNRFMCFGLLLCVLGQIYLSSTVINWLTGEGAGQRRLISMTAIFMLALACLLEKLQTRIRFRYIAVAIGFFIVWNMLHMAQLVRLEFGDEHLSCQQLVVDKVTLPYRLLHSGFRRSPP